MEPKKSSAMSWLVLGAVCILLLFAFGYLDLFTSFGFSTDVKSLASAILGVGGAIFLVVGIIKAIAEKAKK